MKRILFLLSILAFFGCSGERRPDGFPRLYPCSIVITQDGRPLTGYSITLMPLDPEANKWSSGGTADPSGTVHPRTHGRFDGVPEGVYKVSVSKQESEGEEPVLSLDPTREEIKEFQQRSKENPYRLFNVVDRRYASPDTTPLEIQVEARGENRFTLDVGKAVRDAVKAI